MKSTTTSSSHQKNRRKLPCTKSQDLSTKINSELSTTYKESFTLNLFSSHQKTLQNSLNSKMKNLKSTDKKITNFLKQYKEKKKQINSKLLQKNVEKPDHRRVKSHGNLPKRTTAAGLPSNHNRINSIKITKNNQKSEENTSKILQRRKHLRKKNFSPSNRFGKYYNKKNIKGTVKEKTEEFDSMISVYSSSSSFDPRIAKRKRNLEESKLLISRLNNLLNQTKEKKNEEKVDLKFQPKIKEQEEIKPRNKSGDVIKKWKERNGISKMREQLRIKLKKDNKNNKF